MLPFSRKSLLIGTVLIIGVVGLLFLFFKFLHENDLGSFIRQKASPSSNSLTKTFDNTFTPPLVNSDKRVTKKPFGIYISQKNSPVQPERFQGFHTGSDFEIVSGEESSDVPVMAVCDGKLLQKESVSGYGGVLTQSCSLNNHPITILYGHLRLASVLKNPGDSLTRGESLGVLGSDRSQETDGERKHLHLSFHWGSLVNLRGYVDSAKELKDWIDPCLYVCHK